MTPYISPRKNARFFGFIFLCAVFFFEIYGVSMIFLAIPEQYREQVGNICVILVIIFTARLKLHPNKNGVIVSDLMTIVLAFVVAMPMMKLHDGSFINISNIILSFGVVIYMAYCSSGELLNESYSRFYNYIEHDAHKDKITESNDKFMRSSAEVAKRYIERIVTELRKQEEYAFSVSVRVDNEQDFSKLRSNYYNLHRYFSGHGYRVNLESSKIDGYAVKITWTYD